MFNLDDQIEINIALIKKSVLILSSLHYQITIIGSKKELPDNIEANTAINAKYDRIYNQGTGEITILDKDELVYNIINNYNNTIYLTELLLLQ